VGSSNSDRYARMSTGTGGTESSWAQVLMKNADDAQTTRGFGAPEQSRDV
jgi:hypothetical protein